MIGTKSGIFAGVTLMLAASGAGAVPVQWAAADGGNDHYYEYVTTPVDAIAAFAAADIATYLGVAGYLATVTSAAEQAFLEAVVNPAGDTAWLGGSDLSEEGTFSWVGGPEAGQAFTYDNWNAGEPNDLNGEDYMVGWWAAAFWNDLSPDDGPFGYVVEYSGVTPVPVPASAVLLATALGLLCWRRRAA